ncbi:APC family permease [Eudoraea chungangensis]|uniref:APC family permease n=1 Tax=Eudoraea chungangensis TaxID=1481905 RepID=UPI0023EBCEFE|nr:amino acid permease [Eudoraea chungangensis]
MKSPNNKIGWRVATALVIANMIGTGVFTSLGFQLLDIQNTWSILILWLMGGAMALIGAFCYAEVGSNFEKSGGEYLFLSRLLHPLIGYLSGWVSLIIGFAAPVALASMALGAYFSNVLSISPVLIAIMAIVMISLIHSFNLNVSSVFQSYASWFKVLLILLLILIGFYISPEETAIDLSSSWTNEITSSSFAIAFVYVTYSYTGWNAAAYVIDEIDRPQINLPKALIRGTLLVTFLYVLLQMMFLKHASLEELKGTLDIGHVYASNLMGSQGAKMINLLISFFLISSISAMIWVGPRVSMAMGADYKIWRFLQMKNQKNIPVRAIWIQGVISIIYVLTGTFESVLLYCGFILQLSATLTVGSVFVLRKRKLSSSSFKSPFYPVLPLLFILFSLWIFSYLIIDKPLEFFIGLFILGIGVASYFVNKKYF